MWVIQAILASFQINHFNKVLNEMNKQGRVLVGEHKGRLSSGSIVILAIDENERVVNIKEMRGISVFDKFKVKDTFINKSIDELKQEIPNMKDKKIKMSLSKAIEQL